MPTSVCVKSGAKVLKILCLTHFFHKKLHLHITFLSNADA